MKKRHKKRGIVRCRQCYVMIVINGKREPDSIGSLCADCLQHEYGFETDLDKEINKMEFERFDRIRTARKKAALKIAKYSG